MPDDKMELSEIADVITKDPAPMKKLTVIQRVDGALYRTEVMGSQVWLWGKDQFCVNKKAVVAALGPEGAYGRLVFIAPSDNVLAVLEGWGHEVPGAILLGQGIGVEEPANEPETDG